METVIESILQIFDIHSETLINTKLCKISI